MDSNAPDGINDSDANLRGLSGSARKKSKTNLAKRHKPLTIDPPELRTGPKSNDTEGDAAQSPDHVPDSPSPLSHCSSATSSNVESVIPSPLDSSIPLPITPGTRRLSTTARDYRPKRTRSMVDNVRYFFIPRSVSPTPSLSGYSSANTTSSPLEIDGDIPGGIVSWLRKGSMGRQRVVSSPESPGEESTPTTPLSSDENYGNLSRESSTSQQRVSLERHASSPPPGSPRRVAFTDSMPMRRRSLFGPRRDSRPSVLLDSRSSASSDTSASSISRKTLRNVFHFQRSNSLTPVDATFHR